MSKQRPDPRSAPARPPPVAEEDRALFLDAIGAVRRIETDRLDARAPGPKPEPVQSRRDDARVIEEPLVVHDCDRPVNTCAAFIFSTETSETFCGTIYRT